jgi:hypothetical protein
VFGSLERANLNHWVTHVSVRESVRADSHIIVLCADCDLLPPFTHSGLVADCVVAPLIFGTKMACNENCRILPSDQWAPFPYSHI